MDIHVGHRVELQADRVPRATEAMAFTDSYKHMECLGGMRLPSFLLITLFIGNSLFYYLLGKGGYVFGSV